MKSSESSQQKARRIISQDGGVIRTSEAIRAGIHPRTLYALRDKGVLELLSRGVYRLTDQEGVADPDLIIVASRIPHAVICLISALSFHEITTQIPHAIAIALPKGAETPRLNYPPLSIHRFSEEALKQGVENHQINGIKVKVFNAEKTLADCFKFRNKIGMDIVLEALKLYRSKGSFNTEKLLSYARICRVENVMRPYLEVML